IQPIRNGNGVTVLPLDGFARGDRTAGRPGAPGRDLSDSMGKGVRPGLPEIKPVAVAPSLEDNDRRRNRRIAVPSDDLIRRPVVTRNQDANTGATAGTRRERRLISPPERGDLTRGPALVERGSERRDRTSKLREGSNSADTTPGIRPPHPTSPETDGEKAKSEQSERREQLRQQRRLEREQKQEQPPAENREQVRQERRQERERNQAQDQPRPENREQVRQERRQEKQQEPPKSENREQVRQEHRQEKQQQQQPKSENHEQTRQERHQQPEQRPQQQEQRKKP
ncbi:MAG TPA: hypothetical protein VN687_13880, partial [Blastocatellia bacterium]|nr:hypothetical protein [Blastocatellia bacterium]